MINPLTQLQSFSSLICSEAVQHSLAKHVILHKVSDFPKEFPDSTDNLLERICEGLQNQVEIVRERIPLVRISFVNDLSALKVISDRWLTLKALSKICAENTIISIPQTCLASDLKIDLPYPLCMLSRVFPLSSIL